MTGRVSIYTDLSPDAQTTAQEAVKRIDAIRGRMVEDVIQIGRELSAVKAKLGHGHFGPWLKESFDWTERTAQNFMAVAERFGSNAKAVSHLPLTTVYALASPSTPDLVRDDVVKGIQTGKLAGVQEVKDRIAEGRKAFQREQEEERRIARRNPKASPAEVKEKLRKSREAAKARFEQDRLGRQAQFEARQNAVTAFVDGLTEEQRVQLYEMTEAHYISGGDIRAALGSIGWHHPKLRIAALEAGQ